jgi:hypothetical protein
MPEFPRPLSACAILSALTFAVPSLARAAPEEIQVYRDEVAPVHRFEVEVNQSYVITGAGEAEGAFSPAHLYRFTPELNYGFAPDWEVGALMLSTVRGGAFDVHGLKAHMRWIAPKPEAQPWYWGANAEIGWTDRHLEERAFTVEGRAIAGYEGKRWVFAVNPTLETAADGDGSEPVAFQLQTKAGYRLSERWMVGLESYNAFGPVERFGEFGEHGQTLYATVDAQLGRVDLNLGVGKGLTSASDGWTVKAVIGIPLGAH